MKLGESFVLVIQDVSATNLSFSFRRGTNGAPDFFSVDPRIGRAAVEARIGIYILDYLERDREKAPIR